MIYSPRDSRGDAKQAQVNQGTTTHSRLSDLLPPLRLEKNMHLPSTKPLLFWRMDITDGRLQNEDAFALSRGVGGSSS